MAVTRSSAARARLFVSITSVRDDGFSGISQQGRHVADGIAREDFQTYFAFVLCPSASSKDTFEYRTSPLQRMDLSHRILHSLVFGDDA